MACLAARPVVDGFEQEQTGRLRVVRVDANDPNTASYAARWGFRATPTFILLDAAGAELWRGRQLDPATVLAHLP